MESTTTTIKWLTKLFPKEAQAHIATLLFVIAGLVWAYLDKNDDYKAVLIDKSKLEETRNTDTKLSSKECDIKVERAVAYNDSINQKSIDVLNNDLRDANAYNRKLISDLMNDLAIANRNNRVVTKKVDKLETKIVE